MTAMRFYSLASWTCWARPWLQRVAADPSFDLKRACVVARARLPMLTGQYLRALGVERISDLDTERILRLAGCEGLLSEVDSS